MKVYAQKQNQPQQRVSRHLTRPSAQPLAESHAVDSILYLQRTIGNQAVQRLLRANAEGLGVDSGTSAATRFAHDFSRIPVHSKAPVNLQAKRAVNTAGDIYEQEAEVVSEQVMHKAEPQLQLPCACGGECSGCSEKNSSGLQTKFKLNEPDDIYEQEAHRIADQATATSAHPAVNPIPPHIQRFSTQLNGQIDAAPFSVGPVTSGRGMPLEPTLRQDMEQRFGHDFSRVRVHSDQQAARSAEAVGAHAYTLGSHIVFAAGLYQPHSSPGRALLAHELAHVVQQSGQSFAPQTQFKLSTPGDSGEREADAAAVAVISDRPVPPLSPAPSSVQRKCGSAQLGAPTPDCTLSDAGAIGWQFMFKVGCDDLLPGEEAKTSKLKTGSKLKIHGHASLEGDANFNMALSCHRANKVADLLRSARPDCPIDAVLKHGATPQPQPGAVPDPNPPAFWRTVIVEEIRPAPQEPQPKSKCGPDATDWLVNQIAKGKRNAKVLEVKQHLDNAAFFAPLISGSIAGSKPLGMSSSDILEGAVLEKVGDAWNAAGRPQATADANMQIGQASMVGPLEFQTAKLAALGLDVNAVTTLQQLRDASLKWKALVGSGMPFDFKVDSSTMLNPKSANCPDADCPLTITLCSGSAGLNCYEKDLPGNVFYATIGRFVGFSENALQLGSQFAQLSSTMKWDPPEDTQMISFGFGLPGSLTRATFCSALQSAKASFPLRKCGDCNEPLTSAKLIDPQ